MEKGIRLENGYNERADKFWSIYVSKAEQHDSSSTETWKGDMESTLIFAGLFSATVTSFIIESYKLLKQDPMDNMNLLLSRLLAVQTTAATNDSAFFRVSEPPTTTFTPTAAAVSINILWFLSLSCSLGAALCITLVQKWVRDYLQRIQCHNEPLRRARMRAFLFNGTQRWKMDVIIEYIPTLLHASLFLFFAGLIIFLFDLNASVSLVVAAVALMWLAVYVLATVAPALDAAAPYETMLTGLFWGLLQHYRRLCCHSPKPIFEGQDLATVRTYLALNPELSDNVSSPDAQTFMWARSMITADHELETFLESIPGFLSSADGCRTWAAVYSDSSNPLQRQITQLLATCAQATYMERSIRQRRSSTCIEALFAISQHEIHHTPSRGVGPSAIPDLSHYIQMSIEERDQEGLPITKGICTLVLLARQHFISKFTVLNRSIPENAYSIPDNRVSSIPENVVELSRRADKALEDVDIMRRVLEEGLKRYARDPQNHQTDIMTLLRRYFEVVKPSSQRLLDWGRVIGPILYEYEMTKQHTLLSWYSLLPDVCHSLMCGNISGLDAPGGRLDVYAPQVLVFMRRLGVYPQLPDVSQDCSTYGPLPCRPSFQIQQSWTNSEDYEPLCRELEPLSRLLNLLDTGLTVHQMEIRSERLTTAFIYNVPYPRGRPILTDLLGPFSTIAFILEDIRHGARIVALLDFVVKFKTFAPRTVEPHIIHEMIDTIFSEASPELKAGSQVLFVAVLRTILDWEREASPNQRCPFSDSDMMLLVGQLKNLSYKFSLETAERLFGLSPINALHQVSGVEDVTAGINKAIVKPSQNTDNATRIQAVYNHVLTQRAKR
ncbi:hypothetical protein E4T56_gene15894 [Termitomyces sp. T112]|nr:hypothetical protein E4T56_gene15894 [Termitomyces sp. T112]